MPQTSKVVFATHEFDPGDSKRSNFRNVVEGKAFSGGKRSYAKPDSAAPPHKSLKWCWRALEVIPKRLKWRQWPKRIGLLRLSLPLAEPRFIPDKAIIHESAVRRREQVAAYRPVDWLAHCAVEHDVPRRANRPRRRPQSGGMNE